MRTTIESLQCLLRKEKVKEKILKTLAKAKTIIQLIYFNET
jgi:hypothetical protein